MKNPPQLSYEDEAEARAMSWLIRYQVATPMEIILDTGYGLGRVVHLIDSGHALYLQDQAQRQRVAYENQRY